MRRLLSLGALLAFAPAAGAFAQQAGDLQHHPAAGTAAQQPQDDLPPGQRMLNVCRSCHTLDQGARTLIGPNLHGVFGGPRAPSRGTATRST
jgi:cytochrome c